MKIGIISFAHMHANSYALALNNHKDAKLAGIWDANSERGQAKANEFQSEFYSSLDDLLTSDIDAVIICSENVNHREHVMKAASFKKHILCEKPIATELNHAIEMIQACEQHQVILQVAYPVRFSEPIQEMKAMIDRGVIGDVLAVNATNHGQMPGGWFIQKDQSGGGAATDHIVHLMDLLRWTLKDEVASVYAEFDQRFYEIEVEDCGLVQLEMESGVVITIDPSWSRPKSFPTWGDVTLEVIGTNGVLSVDALKQHSVLYNDETNRVERKSWAADMDALLVDDFIACVKNDSAPFISGEDGLRTLEVVKAAYQSDQEKRLIKLKRIAY
ncbi:Gfo/Idh/MocA family protein [Alkalihalobacillus sp. NPDC078783]